MFYQKLLFHLVLKQASIPPSLWRMPQSMFAKVVTHRWILAFASMMSVDFYHWCIALIVVKNNNLLIIRYILMR